MSADHCPWTQGARLEGEDKQELRESLSISNRKTIRSRWEVTMVRGSGHNNQADTWTLRRDQIGKWLISYHQGEKKNFQGKKPTNLKESLSETSHRRATFISANVLVDMQGWRLKVLSVYIWLVLFFNKRSVKETRRKTGGERKASRPRCDFLSLLCVRLCVWAAAAPLQRCFSSGASGAGGLKDRLREEFFLCLKTVNNKCIYKYLEKIYLCTRIYQLTSINVKRFIFL